MKKSEKALVVKSNRLINARYNLGTLETVLFLKLVSKIEKDDHDFKPYEINLAELKKERGIKRNDFYQSIYDAAKNLMKKVYEYDNTEVHFIAPLLASFEHIKKSEKVILHIAPKMKPDLLELKENFTKYYLKNVIRLRCSYAFRIYELLKQVQNYSDERIIEIEELKRKLEVEKLYKRYVHLKSRVIIPAQKELLEKTDLAFDFEEIKEGRKVHALRFIIAAQEVPTKDAAQQVLPLALDAEKAALRPQLIGAGIAAETVDELISEYSAQRIRAALKYSINKGPGFLVEAIRKDYAGFEERKEKEKKKKADQLKAQSEKEQAELEQERKQKEAAKAFDSLSKEEKEKYLGKVPVFITGQELREATAIEYFSREKIIA